MVAQALPLQLLEVYLLPLPVTDAEAMIQLTHVHDEQMDEFAWSKSERIHYCGANDDEIEGWVMRPIGSKEGGLIR